MSEKIILSIIILTSIAGILFDFTPLFRNYKKYNWIIISLYLLAIPAYLYLYGLSFVLNLIFSIIICIGVLYTFILRSFFIYYIFLIMLAISAGIYYLGYVSSAEYILAASFFLVLLTLVKDIIYDNVFEN